MTNVQFSIDKESLMGILKEAASKERTVVEFRTRQTDDGGRELHHAIEITEHVDILEQEIDGNESYGPE